MKELLRAHRIVGSIPRSDRIGGSVAVYAVFHAFYDPEPGLLVFMGHAWAADGTEYPIIPDRLSVEGATSEALSRPRAESVSAAWQLEVGLHVDAYLGRIARGETEWPAVSSSERRVSAAVGIAP